MNEEQNTPATSETATAAEQPAQGLPLFYRDPAPLSRERHAGAHLRRGDYGFAADACAIPLVGGELVRAARHYAVVFPTGGGMPLALLGLENRNLFVDEGKWREGAYVPAYVRRYPFGFMSLDGTDSQYVLAIDEGSDRFLPEAPAAGEETRALYDDAGQPSETTRSVLEFCRIFQDDVRMTRAFMDALREQDLLVPRRVDATLPGGRMLGVDGFEVIDAERFSNLPPEILAQWHRNSWLMLAYAHLASLEHLETLLQLQARDEARAA